MLQIQRIAKTAEPILSAYARARKNFNRASPALRCCHRFMDRIAMLDEIGM